MHKNIMDFEHPTQGETCAPNIQLGTNILIDNKIPKIVPIPFSPPKCIDTKKPAERGPTGFSFSRCCSEFALAE